MVKSPSLLLFVTAFLGLVVAHGGPSTYHKRTFGRRQDSQGLGQILGLEPVIGTPTEAPTDPTSSASASEPSASSGLPLINNPLEPSSSETPSSSSAAETPSDSASASDAPPSSSASTSDAPVPSDPPAQTDSSTPPAEPSATPSTTQDPIPSLSNILDPPASTSASASEPPAASTSNANTEQPPVVSTSNEPPTQTELPLPSLSDILPGPSEPATTTEGLPPTSAEPSAPTDDPVPSVSTDVPSPSSAGPSEPVTNPPEPSSQPTISLPISIPSITDIINLPSSQPPSQEPSQQPPTQPPVSEPTGLPSISNPVPSSQPASEPPVSEPTSGPSISISNPIPSGSISQPPTEPSSQPPTEPSSQPPTEPSSRPPTEPSSQPASEPSSQPPTSFPSGEPTSQGPSSVPNGVPTSAVSGEDSSSVRPSGSTSIAFPSGTSSAPASTVTQVSTEFQVSTVISIASEFMFYTASELALAPEPSSTPLDSTLTDPDQATSTPSVTPTVLPVVNQLPPDLPGRIYPPSVLDLSDVAVKEALEDKTLIAILFNKRLSWPFVANNGTASTQILAWLPGIINAALGNADPQTHTQTLYLQAYIPASYTGPEKKDELGTMFLAYVPTEQVETLASLIRVKTSVFYVGLADARARELADQIVPSFNLLSVPDPNKSGTGANGGDSQGAASASGASRTREDAIIGVVSALGGIALLVLLFLLYRAWKRRQELANKRRSDPQPGYIGERTPGRDFDQDSVGGQRRRSFYFAEDSLRQGEGMSQANSSGWVSFGPEGQSQQPQQGHQDEEYWDYSRNGANQMSQRRAPIGAGDIGAPILRGSTMNW